MAKYKCKKDCFDNVFYCKGEIYEFADPKKVSEHFEPIPAIKEQSEQSDKVKTEAKASKNGAKVSKPKASNKKVDDPVNEIPIILDPASETDEKEPDIETGKE